MTVVFFGGWMLMAVGTVTLLALASCLGMFQGPATSPVSGETPRGQIQGRSAVLLLVLPGAISIAVIWLTRGNILLALMSPLGLTISVLCCLGGLIFGARKLIGKRQRALRGFWFAFFIPPLLYSSVALADAVLLVDVAVERGVFTDSKAFYFGNFTALRVEGKAGEYAWRHYNRSRGDMFHVPYDVLELRVDGHHYVVSDKQGGNQALIINGTKYTVRKGLRLTRGGAVVADDSLHHPGIPSRIPE